MRITIIANLALLNSLDDVVDSEGEGRGSLGDVLLLSLGAGLSASLETLLLLLLGLRAVLGEELVGLGG